MRNGSETLLCGDFLNQHDDSFRFELSELFDRNNAIQVTL
jgi:hypothetical protein